MITGIHTQVSVRISARAPKMATANQTNSNSKSKQPITSFFTSFLTSSITTSLASTHNYYSQPLVTLIDKKGIRPPSTVQQSCHQFQQEGRYVIFGLPPAILNFHQRVRGKTELFLSI